ncbi:reverse transcriptase domain-containing protein [Tanacetum coccineum]
MSEDDEEKTAFYTDQGTYCYTKNLFGLKNAGATYQPLVDSAFQTQLGRNLEAYVDDMVIKSKIEQSMIMDIAETFNNLWKINLKLNPKKCSFGIGEGKFLGYMVASRANSKKTKAVADIKRCSGSGPKGKADTNLGLADFINEILVGTKHLEICSLTDDENSKEWTLYTDGASCLKKVGVWLILIDLSGNGIYLCHTSNLSKHQQRSKVRSIDGWFTNSTQNEGAGTRVKVESKLVACQMNGEFVASSEGMAKYLAKAKEHAALFKIFLIGNIPRNQIQKADVLSKLALVSFNHLTKEILVEVLNTKSVDTQEVNTIVEEEKDN